MNERIKDNNLIVILGWALFGILLSVFFVFFYKDLPFVKDNNEGEISDSDNKITTNYIYETNKNLDINVLVTSYLDALVNCRQDELKGYVTDPSMFDDMSQFEIMAERIVSYNNINCYTVKGLNEDETIVYVVSNLIINNVESKPLDIQTMYIKKVDNNYYIDNTVKDSAVLQYIEEMNVHEDIFGLYKAVQDNINHCLENDETFVTFYNEIGAN